MILTDLGFPRQFDITCCDLEPAIIGFPALFVNRTNDDPARNVLLFTILLSDYNSEKPHDLWNLYHNFYIDSATFELICQHSKKLIECASSIVLWSVEQNIRPIFHHDQPRHP